MDGLPAALERVRGIEQTLQSLRAGRPGSTAFSQVLAGAVASGPSPSAEALPSATATSAAWTSAVQRPASLSGTALPGVVLPGAAAPAGAAPAAAAAYGNGQVPDSALVSIGGGERLQAGAAAGFLAMREAAARDGVQLPVNDSYRSLQEQRDMAARKGLYSQGGLAAQPGTSTHGLGRSVDLHLDQAAQSWMRTNGARFGYANDVAREPWHWTFTATG